MFKRLRTSLLSPLIAKLDKLMDKMSRSFKRQEDCQIESRNQLKDRMSMLSRQVDEARVEFHRGFRIQEECLAGLRQQLDQVLAVVNQSPGNARHAPTTPAAASQHAAPAAAGTPHQRGGAGLTAALGLHDTVAADRQLPAGKPWLAPRHGERADAEALRVSVVMPVWNRRDLVERALQSVRAQSETRWECLVVDDGSEDDTAAVVEAIAHEDPRIRLIRLEHHGAAAARNVAVRQARGELIAYLDSDNTYHPDYLAQVVAAFEGDADLMCCYAGQRVVGEGNQPDWVRQHDFDWQRLLQGNFIDLNVFAHRRRVWEMLGGFDESLRRLHDWDLILRYTRRGKAATIPGVGGDYRSDADNRISAAESAGYATFLVRQKFRQTSGGPSPKTRILYVLWRYPQLNDSSVRHELMAALDAGFEIEVWSEGDAGAPYPPDVPVHRGALLDAVRQCNPHVIHVHRLNVARFHLADLVAAELPVTVRAHSFDFNSRVTDELAASQVVEAVYLLPQQARAHGKAHPKIRTVRAGIDPRWHRPSRNKDRKLVLRAGGAVHGADHRTFLEAARLCPDHEFVLIVCRCLEEPTAIEDLRALNKSLGNPAAILVDLQHETVAQWMMRAALYLHTMRPAVSNDTPLGMPTSVIEAMACGCVPLLRRHPSLEDAFGAAEPLWYGHAEEAAALVRSTAAWTEAERTRRVNLCLDRVFPEWISSEANANLFADWQSLASSAGRKSAVPQP